MSKLKDKLSANMRMVKANQPQPTAPAKAQAPAKPVAKAATEKPAAAPSSAPLAGDVANSCTALFPARVWPD